jgi:hypothetical protein
MNHSAILKGSAVVMALFGIALLFAPNTLNEIYKAPAMNGPGVYNSMLYGSALIAFALLNWQAAGDSLAAVRRIIVVNLVADVLGLYVTVSRQLMDAGIPAMAWGNVVIFAVFTVVFGMLYLRGNAPAAQAQPTPTA